MGDGSRVDDIANNEQELEKKVTELCGYEVVLDANWTVGTDLEELDPSICAVLIMIHGLAGAVRVYSSPMQNVVTGPKRGRGYVISVIKSGQTCNLFGTPSVRYFRRRPSQSSNVFDESGPELVRQLDPASQSEG